MKMTKALAISWTPSDDPTATKLSIACRLFKGIEMCLENKTINQAVTVGHRTLSDGPYTITKFFTDQATVEEYLNFCKILESRYQTKIEKVEITDI
jgi:hypothetical protein